MLTSSSPVTFWKCNTGIGGASSTTNEDLRRSLERVSLVRSLTFRGMAGDMGECSTITEGCSQPLRFAQGDNAGHTKSKKVQSTVKLFSILKQIAIPIQPDRQR